MAFSELEIARHKKVFATFRETYGPKPEIRSKVDWGCRIEGQSVELYEIRPRWDDPTQKTHTPIAKAAFVKSTALWKIYWMRASGKWNSYSTRPEVGTLEKFFQIVHEDADCCFFG